jgi:hypothetical protein
MGRAEEIRDKLEKLTRTSLRAEIPKDDDRFFTLFDRPAFDGLDEIVLCVERPCLASKS